MQHRFALAIALGVLISCAPPPTDVAAVRADIAATWSSFRTSWLAGNPSAAVAGFFTEDGINLVPDAPEAQGRSAIDSALSAVFRAGFKVTAITMTTDEVVAEGDLAYERGHFEQTAQQGAAPATVQHSRYLATWRRQPDGHWRCSRFMYNNAPPAQQMK